MSKLRSALEIMGPGVNRSSSKAKNRNDAPTVRAAIQSEKQRSGTKSLGYANKISVDRKTLVSGGVLVAPDQEDALRGEIRRLKWPVLANAFGEQAKLISRGNIVMVTSAIAGEGKTFTAVNLAMSISAEKDVDVLLVDTDIAKPHISEVFGLQEQVGVTDYLSGDVPDVSDVIVKTDIDGLSILPAGRPDSHASELMASNRMNKFVGDLSAGFPNTVVLFDTSPLLQTNESQVLSRIVGQALLVIGANKTPQPAIQEAVAMLGSDAIVNVIFNGMRNIFGQSYRYGGYYGYKSRR